MRDLSIGYQQGIDTVLMIHAKAFKKETNVQSTLKFYDAWKCCINFAVCLVFSLVLHCIAWRYNVLIPYPRKYQLNCVTRFENIFYLAIYSKRSESKIVETGKPSLCIPLTMRAWIFVAWMLNVSERCEDRYSLHYYGVRVKSCLRLLQDPQ